MVHAIIINKGLHHTTASSTSLDSPLSQENANWIALLPVPQKASTITSHLHLSAKWMAIFSGVALNQPSVCDACTVSYSGVALNQPSVCVMHVCQAYSELLTHAGRAGQQSYCIGQYFCKMVKFTEMLMCRAGWGRGGGEGTGIKLQNIYYPTMLALNNA
jgi:hypothetical protein